MASKEKKREERRRKKRRQQQAEELRELLDAMEGTEMADWAKDIARRTRVPSAEAIKLLHKGE